MADVTINSLDPIDELANPDLLVVWDQSSNTAKNISGQQMTTWLTALADGHGGIASIAKTGTSGLIDTYTITYADTSTSTFTVTNGAKGDKGNTGATGASGTPITAVTYTGGGTAGQPGATDTYTCYAGSGNAVGTFSVYNGQNGTGTVKTVNSTNPDANGNVALYTDSTANNWHIRTWADGTLEAWYAHSESFSCTSAYGGFYINGVNTVTFTVPSAFNTVQVCNVSGNSATNGFAGMITFAASISGTVPVLCMSTASGTVSAVVNVYLRGTAA